MPSRALAAVLVASLTAWLATPAFASVSCRNEVVRCSKCPRLKALKTAAMKSDCCIVTPASAHPVADDARPERFTVALAPAADQALATPREVASTSSAGLTRRRPLLEFRSLPLLC